MKSNLLIKNQKSAAASSPLKTSADWGADDTKLHAREDRLMKRQEQQQTSNLVDTVWAGIHKELNQLKQTFQVKPGKSLAQYSIPRLADSSDPAEKKAWYRVCSLVNQFLTQNFDEEQVRKFKEREGNIPQILTSEKAKKAHKRRVQSSLMRKRLR